MDETVRILLAHNREYPEMEIADYVKLLYQSVFGPAHFADDPSFAEVRSFIEKEAAGITTTARKKPMFEPIGNGYHRIHLDHVASGRIDADKLAESFHASMKNAPGRTEASMALFQRATRILFSLIEAGEIPLDPEESRAFLATHREKGHPPIHHSDTFRENYAPHYRIVHEEFLHVLRQNHCAGT